MSAYVMDPADIAQMGMFVKDNARDGTLWVHRAGRPSGENYRTPQQVADLLMRENVRSVNYRYSERKRAPLVRLPPMRSPSFTEMRDLLSRWNYQACERNDFKRSEAFDTYVALLELTLDVATGRNA